MSKFTDILRVDTARRSRHDRIAIEGSPAFDLASPALAADATWQVGLADNATWGTAIAKYLPMDFAEIENQGTVRVDVVVNDLLTFRVAPSATRTIEGVKMNSMRIVNTSSSVALLAGDVALLVRRLGVDADAAAKRRAAGVA